MYNPRKQYRCTIIRGKAQKEIDNLLPVYAKVIDEICPCNTNNFPDFFNNAFKEFLPESQRKKKTLDNHRTEIAGKLFGMYYFSKDGIVYESQRTQKYLDDNDQPAFFKDICYKMQFPNGMDSPQTLNDKLKNKICIRPNAYVLKVLQLAERVKQTITVKDIGYYILNSLDVLQGHADPHEVLKTIMDDYKIGIHRKITAYDEKAGKEKASSYTMQHIRDQLNYLELANLIRIHSGKITPHESASIITLNKKENNAINLFAQDFNKAPEFNVYKFDLSSAKSRDNFFLEWRHYFSMLSKKASEFETSLDALLPQKEQPSQKLNLTEFGDMGEQIVYEYEKRRVSAYNPRLTNKVIPFGKIRGVGFDIQSIVAKPGNNAEFCKYIEVKSTKRLTTPDLTNNSWVDTLNITRNEWIAAQQHGEYYSIYRLYFTKDGIIMFTLNNIAQKEKEHTITVSPTVYRLVFSNKSIDNSIPLKQQEEGFHV